MVLVTNKKTASLSDRKAVFLLHNFSANSGNSGSTMNKMTAEMTKPIPRFAKTLKGPHSPMLWGKYKINVAERAEHSPNNTDIINVIRMMLFEIQAPTTNQTTEKISHFSPNNNKASMLNNI